MIWDVFKSYELPARLDPCNCLTWNGWDSRYNRKDKYVDFVGEYHLDLIQDHLELKDWTSQIRSRPISTTDGTPQMVV